VAKTKGEDMFGVQEAIGVSYEALILCIKITLPTLLITTVVGLLMTIFQAMTQINESTLQQDIKIFATLALLFIEAPIIYYTLKEYALTAFDRINGLAPPPGL
jgi:flagellar biosynthesis protein FliQ